jgi:hypothetical protein
MVTAQHGQCKITRNMSFFKPVDKTLKNIGLDEEEEDEEEEEEVVIQQSAGADIPQNGRHAEPPKRYSLRKNRKPPKYLQDYVRQMKENFGLHRLMPMKENSGYIQLNANKKQNLTMQ